MTGQCSPDWLSLWLKADRTTAQSGRLRSPTVRTSHMSNYDHQRWIAHFFAVRQTSQSVAWYSKNGVPICVCVCLHPFRMLGTHFTGLYVTNCLSTCVQWPGTKQLSQNWDHYLPHTSEYLTHACHDSWEADALFSVKVHKIEVSCQQFILIEKPTFCFCLRGANLAHKEHRGSWPLPLYKICHRHTLCYLSRHDCMVCTTAVLISRH